jgi:hypothetical protein
MSENEKNKHLKLLNNHNLLSNEDIKILNKVNYNNFSK